MFMTISVQTADVFEMLDIWRTSWILVHMLWRRLKEKVAKKNKEKTVYRQSPSTSPIAMLSLELYLTCTPR